MVSPAMIALITIVPIMVLKLMVVNAVKGWLGIVLKIGMGIGAAIAAVATASFCPALGFFLVVVAIILGEFFGVLAIYLSPYIPGIGPVIGEIIAPISGSLYILLVLTIILFVVHILEALAIIPVIGIVLMILSIVIPIIIIWMVWGGYVENVSGIMECWGGERVAVPGTGGISIGT